MKKLGAPPNWVGATAQAYSGIIFIVLVFFLAYFGASVFLHVRQQKIAVPSDWSKFVYNFLIIQLSKSRYLSNYEGLQIIL